MRYLSLFSGIEAATVAWHPLGWEPAGFAEIEAFPSAVLAHHYPNVPNYGDVTRHKEWDDGPVDLICGGSPCQSFSVAGLRKGMDDPRGNMALVYLAIVDRKRPRWIVFENVPGLLSSNEGRDFGSFLGALGKLGYGFAYRVLDAQFFGVPQRRRRVFVIGYSGDWRRAAAVLFERHSLQGHPAPSREAGPGVAALTANGVGTCGADDNQAQAGHLIPQVVGPLACNTGPNGHDAGNFACNQAVDAGHLIPSTGHTAHCLNAGGMGRQDYDCDGGLIAKTFAADDVVGAMVHQDHGGIDTQSAFSGYIQPVCFSAKADNHGVAYGSAVRRLTPRECERLQGFPDDYTLIPYRGKPASDGPRYKALGNSMAVPVMRWIGERISHVDSLTLEAAA